MKTPKIKSPDRTAVLWYKEDKRECCCAVNVRQAQTVIGILEQPPAERRACARALNTCLSHLRSAGRLDHKESIAVRRRTQSGLVAAVDTPLYWRVCVWLMFVCITDNESARRDAISMLKLFVSGGDITHIDTFTKKTLIT